MIVVLGAHGAGGAEVAHVLRLLGCRDGASLADIDDAILREADGTWRWVDPDVLASVLPRLPAELQGAARVAVSGERAASRTVRHDPRLCLTIPFWRSIVDEPAYVVVHRHPLEAAHALRAEHGIPVSAGLSLWQLYTLSALHHSSGRPRLLVRYDELRRDPVAVARALHRFLEARGTTLARADEIIELAAPQLGRASGALLTRAQIDLHETMSAGRWPDVDPADPYEHLAKDPLVLLARATGRARTASSRDDDTAQRETVAAMATELGRMRASAWHLELRERDAAARLDRSGSELLRARARVLDLEEALERERAARARAEQRVTDLTQPAPSAATSGSDRPRPPPLSLGSPEERMRLADAVLKRFKKQLYTEWTASEGVPYCGIADARPMRVMVGTLHSDENEYEQCIESVRKQGYRGVKHEIFSGLGKKESIATLMTAFQRSDCDLLVKVDADMVLTAPDFVERMVRVFQTNPGIDLLQVAILDFFSGGPIQGINAYRKTAEWSADRQDSLFTDKTQVPGSKRLIVWPTFVRDAVHSPNPSPFQAFHFGVHRGIKTLQPGGRNYEVARAEEQFAYLEKTWSHFQLRRDLRLAFACLGFELALTGRYELEHLDYTNPSLRQSFAELEHLDVVQVEAAVVEMRSRRVPSENVNRVRDRREELLALHQAPVQSIVALLPHTKVYGGVNRFFELARQFARLGVRFVIAQPESRDASSSPERTDYPDVEVRYYSEVIDDEWDVVLCGDAFGGVMLTMPLFRAKLGAVYLLNGWGRCPLNLAQIAVVSPDVIIANSSYSAAQYTGRAPAVVPGGVDLAMFRPPEHPRARSARFKICAYPGRRKPSKRFEDTLDACQMLHERGVPIELHAFDQGTLHLDVPFPFVFHGALEKERVRELFWQMDLMVCAEEDGGWSNPAAEAMACGTPLVCTDAGTVDYAIDGETALVVPRRDPVAIAAAIERMYREPELAERLRAAGLARIRGFGWPQVARGLLDALSDARLDADGRALKNARALERLSALGVR